MKCQLIFVVLLAVSVSLARAQPADMILLGVNVHTMNLRQPNAEAIAVRAGRIVFVGDASRVEALRGARTRTLDLGGSTLLPGLMDAHAHIMNLGNMLANVNVVGTGSIEEVHAKLVEAAAERGPGAWIVGRGWDQNDWDVKQFPSAADLDDIPNPIYLKRVDGHAAWVNRRALEAAGVTKDTASPAGGKILRHADGSPTGVLIDHATDLVARRIPESTREEKTRRIRRAIAECHKYGLVGVHDAGTERDEFEIFTQLRDAGELDFRLYCMLETYEDSLFSAERLAAGPYVDDFVSLRALKIYVDGALGSRGAALLEPYSDDPENRGLFRNEAASLAAWSARAAASGFQVCAHAIGDAGNRTALDVYERLIAARDLQDHRWRIEHAQVISLVDITRFAANGIIPVVQPTHCTSDMYWAEDRVGPERIKGAYAWRTLVESGAVLPLGSDFPVEGVNPLWGIYAAVTRQDHKGWPAGGWYADQTLTMYEAVRGFTADAAYASFSEAATGTIEVGKFADFTVLDHDLFAIDASAVLETKVVMTIVGGKIVYQETN